MGNQKEAYVLRTGTVTLVYLMAGMAVEHHFFASQSFFSHSLALHATRQKRIKKKKQGNYSAPLSTGCFD